MRRATTAVPSYVVVLAVMVVVGSVVSSFVLRSYSPLSRQEPYLGAAVRYDYRLDRTTGLLTINIVNTKEYDAKVDVLLLTDRGEVMTACVGTMVYATKNTVINGTLQLLGVVVDANEMVSIICPGNNVRSVRVFEHGVDVAGSRVVARIGRLPGWYGISDISFGIGSPWLVYGFSYRMPLTLVLRQSYNVVYGEVVISITTVGSEVFNLVHTNTRPDGKDFIVVTTSGVLLPTSVQKTGNRITVTFELRNAQPGVHHFYLYFGNRDLNQELNPIRTTPPWTPKVGTPSGLPRTYLSAEFAYPSYVLPEANWYPACDAHRYGHLYTTSSSTLNSWESAVASGGYDQLAQLMTGALSDRKRYPIGTSTTAWDYSNLNPKTAYGNAPWATLTVVPIPSFGQNTLVVNPTTTLYVASDDGSSVYLIGLNHNARSVYRYSYYASLSLAHGPRYAGHLGFSSWNYERSGVTLSRQAVENHELFLVILQQNGMRSGAGSGWVDFRFSMLWIEKPVIGFGATPIREDWLTGWSYRKRLSVTGDSLGPIDNYVLRVMVRHTSGTDSGDTMFCNGRCRVDFADIRFTASDGRTQLPYCMVEKVDGQYAIFYVRVRRPAQGATESIYVYYGNQQATSQSNCQAVFGRSISMRYGGDRFYDALILANRESNTFGSYLCYVTDDGACYYELPFRVKIYDTEVGCVYVSSNGFVRWDCVSDSSHSNYLDTWRKILAPHWDDLYEVNIYVGTDTDATLGQYIIITWNSAYYGCPYCSAMFQLYLYRNWVIQFNIMTATTFFATPTEYISAGNGVDYIDLTPRWSNMESVIFVPRFSSAYGPWGPEESM